MFERSRNVALGVLALGLLAPGLLSSCGDRESGKQPSSARKVAKKQPKKMPEYQKPEPAPEYQPRSEKSKKDVEVTMIDL